MSAIVSFSPSINARGTAAAAFCLAASLLLVLAPTRARACACGCGVFEVGTSTMLPTSSGCMLTLSDAFQDQNQNWSGSSLALAVDNPDRQISTNFLTVGAEDLFNRRWGLQVELPYVTRSFRTVGGPSGNDPVNLHWSQWGDIRIRGVYTGFSPDLSSGFTFGLKLPNGRFTFNDAYGDVDRDSQIGTGSTDLLLGGFHRGYFGSASAWEWFFQGNLDQPVLFRGGYRPGLEVDAAVGLHTSGWAAGRARITPIAQVLGSARASDSGVNAADPVASGYQRILLSPGVEVDLRTVRLYADVEFPILQHVTGNQLVGSVLWKASASFAF